MKNIADKYNNKSTRFKSNKSFDSKNKIIVTFEEKIPIIKSICPKKLIET